MSGTLEFRHGLLAAYPDVYTAAARTALAALAPLNRDRRRIMDERIARRRERAVHGRRLDFLPPDALIARTTLRVSDAREGRFTGSEIPADLERQWIQGTGPATRPRATAESGLRNVAYALLSGADGWMFDGEDALGQVDTMSLDNQRNLKLAFDEEPIFLRVADDVAAEMNALGTGLPRPADVRRLAPAARLHDPDLPSSRTAPGRPSRARRGRHRLFRIDRRPRALRRQQPRATAGGGPVHRPLPPEDPDRRGGGAVERHARGARAPPRAAGRDDQGLRARRADRGLLSADGDPRRSRDALRRLQHRPLGLHQQRRRRPRLGWGVRQPQHRRDRHDLRLHAPLRGPRPAGGEHPGPGRALRALAGRDGSQHPGGLGGGRGRRHEAGGRGRRTRAARGRERQMGGALEDGADPAARLGAGRRRQSARPAVPPAHLHGGGRRRLDPARAGAADRPRRARSLERRSAIRQCLRSGLPGRCPQTRRLLRQRRRALPDGGHGDRRDPDEHPLGMAAQERPVHRRRSGDGRRRRRCLLHRAVRPAPRRGVRQAAAGEQPRRPRRLEADDAADRPRHRRGLRPRARQAAVVHRPARTSTSTTTISRRRSDGSRASSTRSAGTARA